MIQRVLLSGQSLDSLFFIVGCFEWMWGFSSIFFCFLKGSTVYQPEYEVNAAILCRKKPNKFTECKLLINSADT